jgi:hypothetical protein
MKRSPQEIGLRNVPPHLTSFKGSKARNCSDLVIEEARKLSSEKCTSAKMLWNSFQCKMRSTNK